MHYRRHILPIRSTDVHNEVWFLDIHRRPGVAKTLQQQGLRGPVRLLEVWHMGHHRGARLPQCVQWNQTHRDGHHVQRDHPQKDPVLHCQFNLTYRAHFVPLCVGVLLAGRGGREGDLGHKHSTLTGCVLAACLKDLAPHVTGAASDCQVLAIHLHHEHRQYPRYRGHYQLELQGPTYTLHAQLDTDTLLALSAHVLIHEKAQEDQVKVDDGDTGSEPPGASGCPQDNRLLPPSAPALRSSPVAPTTLGYGAPTPVHGLGQALAIGVAPTPKPWHARFAPRPEWLQEQDRGHGTIRPPPPIM